MVQGKVSKGQLSLPSGHVEPFDDYEVVGWRPMKVHKELKWFPVQELIHKGPHRLREENIHPIKETLDTKTKMIQCEIHTYEPEETEEDV